MNKYALKIFDEDISKYKDNIFKLAEWIYKANTINIFDSNKRKEDSAEVIYNYYLEWLKHYEKHKEVYESEEYKFAIFIYKKLFNAKMYVEDVEITDAFRYSLLAEKDTKEFNKLKENYKNDLKAFNGSLRKIFATCDKKALSEKIKENYYYNNQVAQLCPMIDINRKELLSNVLNEILDKEEVTFDIEPLFPSEEFLSDTVEIYDLIKLILNETKLVGKYEVIYIYKLYRKELYQAIKEFFMDIPFEVIDNFIEEFIDNIDDYTIEESELQKNYIEDKIPISANIAELQNYELSKDILYMTDKRTYTKRQFINLSFYFSFDLDMTEELLNMAGYTIKHSYDPVDKILKNCFTIGLNQEYTSVVVKTETGIEITKRLFDNGKIGISYENFLILQKKLDSVETLTSSEQDKYNKCLEHTINYFTQFYNKKLASIKKREDVIKNIESDIDKLSKEAGSLLMSTEEKDKIKYERINEKVYNLEIDKSKKEKSLNRIRNKKYNYKTVFVNSDYNNTITFTLKEMEEFLKMYSK